MNYELFIGLRYLKAKRKQSFVSVITLISILGITVGVTALIVVLSVMTGFEKDLREKILGINAHLIVSEYGGKMYGHNYILDSVKDIEEVKGASPFIYGQAMLAVKGSVLGVVVRGVDSATLKDVTVLPDRIRSGSLSGLDVGFDAEGELPGVAIGSELSSSLGLFVGDEVRVVSPFGAKTAMGAAPRSALFKVSAIFEMGMYEYDSSLAFISIENAQKFFRLGKAVSGVEIKISDLYRANALRDIVADKLNGPYAIRTWEEMNQNLFSALKLERVAMFIILTLIIFVAALNIISTLIMVVMEKGKDIAILKSMGASSASIMKIFMVEGLIIGVVGTFLGTVVGLITALNLESMLVFIEETFDFKILPPSVYYIDRLPSNVEPIFVLSIVLVSIGISFLATIYPSWKASKFDPVEGIRYE